MIHLKITNALYKQAYTDIRRPHPFAAERVGYLLLKHGELQGKARLIIPTKYITIPDNHYLYDPAVGARIGTAAIRSILQTILDTGMGVLYTHMHEHRGRPRFSLIDLSSIKQQVQSFKNIKPSMTHGALLLSLNDCSGLIWQPGESKSTTLNKISVTGYPIKFLRR